MEDDDFILVVALTSKVCTSFQTSSRKVWRLAVRLAATSLRNVRKSDVNFETTASRLAIRVAPDASEVEIDAANAETFAVSAANCVATSVAVKDALAQTSSRKLATSVAAADVLATNYVATSVVARDAFVQTSLRKAFKLAASAATSSRKVLKPDVRFAALAVNVASCVAVNAASAATSSRKAFRSTEAAAMSFLNSEILFTVLVVAI